MARNIAADTEGFVYRAVIEHPRRTEYRGPYTNEGTAKGQITRETTAYWASEGTTGRVQRAHIQWEDM